MISWLKKYALVLFLVVYFFIILKLLEIIKQNVSDTKTYQVQLSQNKITIEKNKEAIKNLQPKLEVKFWKIDEENLKKGDFVGSVKLVDSKLIIEVSDSELKSALQNPYTPIGNITQEANSEKLEKGKTYQPGTIEHLKAIAEECWRWGLISEVKEYGK